MTDDKTKDNPDRRKSADSGEPTIWSIVKAMSSRLGNPIMTRAVTARRNDFADNRSGAVEMKRAGWAGPSLRGFRMRAH